MSLQRFLLLLHVFLFLCVTSTYSATLSGRVIDTYHQPVENASVTIFNLDMGVSTDSDGFFLLVNLSANRYRITISHINYQVYSGDIVIHREDEVYDLGTLVIHPKIHTSDDVVYTATRSATRIENLPVTVSNVNRATIQSRNAKTAAEALREETGVFIQKTSHGGGSANIRGLSSNQILLLVDGIRLNNSTYRLGNHPYLTSVDYQALQQIEVVHGPSSMLYGSDALGGTINLITRQPSFSMDEIQANARSLGRFATADNEITWRNDLSLSGRNWAFLGGFSIKDFEDLRHGTSSGYERLESLSSGSGQSPTGFSAWDADAKLVFCPNSRGIFTLAYQRSNKSRIPRYDKYEYNNYYRWDYTPQNRELMYLTYEREMSHTFLRSIQVTLSSQIQQEGRETQKTEESTRTRELDRVGTIGVSVQTFGQTGIHHFTGGVDFYADQVESIRRLIETDHTVTYDFRGRYPDDSRYYNMGVFLQDEIEIADRWIILPGIRYSLFRSEFTLKDTSDTNFSDVEDTYTSVTGSLGFVYHVSTPLTLRLNAAQAFRAPNLSDLTVLGESKGDIYIVPNPSLEPEKTYNIDLGFRYSTDSFQADGSTFYTRLYDMLDNVPATFNGYPTIERNGAVYTVKNKDNHGEGYIYGWELSASYRFYHGFSTYAGATYIRGRNTTADEPIGGIPPLFGNVGIRWSNPTMRLEGYVRWAKEQRRLSADDLDDPRIPEHGTPGWYTVNARMQWDVSRLLQLQVAMENILDQLYREHGSGVNGPGRNFIVGIQCTL